MHIREMLENKFVMIAVPGARGGLGVYVRLQSTPTQPFSFSPPRGRAVHLFFGYSILKTYSPFVVVISLLSLPTPAEVSIPTGQLSRYRLQKRCGEASWLAAALLRPTHPQQSQSTCYADFHRSADCLEASSLQKYKLQLLDC